MRSLADEVPFDIPDSWEWVRISSIAALVTKGTTPRGGNVAYSDNGIGFLRAENVAGLDRLDLSKLNHIDEATHTGFLKRSIIAADDVLITIAGTLGRTAIVKEENLPLNANQAVAIIRLVDSHSVDLRYLVYALNAPAIQDKLTAQKKITAIPNLTLEIISDCLVPIPPLNEQRRIVKQFALFVPQIAEYEGKQTELNALNTGFPEALKKSILQEAVQGKLVPQDPSDEPAEALLERIWAEKQRLIKEGKIKKDKHESVIFRRDNSHYEKLDGVERCIDDELPFEIPENWRWCRLGTIAAVLGGKRIPAGRKLTEFNTGHVYIRVSDMTDGGVSTDRLLYVPEDIYPSISKYIINKADVFITVAGTIGRVGKIPDELDGANMTENADRLVLAGVNQDWLIKVLQSGMIQEQIAQATTQVGQPKLAIARIERFLIPLPPLAEQHRIVQRIEELLPLVKGL